MPANPIALELLSETGPLAVSSANRSGEPSARTAADAESMLGDTVTVYLDGGPAGEAYEAIGEREGDTSSTIVDATGLGADGGALRIVRAGVISREQIAAVVGEELLGEASGTTADTIDGATDTTDGATDTTDGATDTTDGATDTTDGADAAAS
jgi:L-threonylcarbamoyladenylate synthase